MEDRPDRELALLQMLQQISAEDVSQAGLGKPTPPDEPTTELETVSKDRQVVSGHSTGVTGPVTLKNLFQHRLTHPLVIDLMLLHRYEVDWLDWEPETLQIHLAQDFGGISDLNMSKAMATKALHLVDAYWERWEVFGWCTMSFNDLYPDFEVLQVPTVAQCAVSVDIANRLRTDVPWSNEVKLYLASVHRHDDLYMVQPPLDFVDVDSAGMPIDKESIKKQWADVRISGKEPTAETVEAEQLRRMLLVFEYLKESQERLRQQLPLVQYASL